MQLDERGTHWLAMDTHSNYVELPADQFNACLRTEGLDAVLGARKASGTADNPGRERYRRHIKNIVRVGAGAQAAAMTPTGQRLEILPMTQLASATAGDPIEFRIVFEQKPLRGALVKAWYKTQARTVTLDMRTDDSGKVRFTLPSNGIWMFSVVHMQAARGDPRVDWDSYWGNLTLEIGDRR